MVNIGFSAQTTGVTSSGTLSQLIAIGQADTHLTAKPSVTFWRLRVHKCTNFAMESITQTYTGAPQWGGEVQVTLNRTGDLVYWMYVILEIPGIYAEEVSAGTQHQTFPSIDTDCNPCKDVNDSIANGYDPTGSNVDDGDDDNFVADCHMCTGLQLPYATWVDEIGHAALSSVFFSIGGQVIDVVYSHYMHMWEELSGKPGKRLQEMIGKGTSKADNVKASMRDRRLYVPLPFFFTRHSGNALPLVSLQFHSMQVHIKFEQLNKLIQVSPASAADKSVVVRKRDGSSLSNNDLTSMLDTSYVYLDMEERDRFAVGAFQQVVTQVQQYAISSNNQVIRCPLTFNHPTIELMWALRRKCHADQNDTFNYSGANMQDPIDYAALRINNLPRFQRESQYFRLVQPWQHHTNIPKNFVYCYSFALHPEDCHPSGSLNFSRIDNVDFSVQVSDPVYNNDDNTCSSTNELYVYARSFNVLRFKEGLGGILFSN